MKQFDLAIILPCYNPPKNWSKNVISDFRIIQDKFDQLHIGLVIVNDGSTLNPQPEVNKCISSLRDVYYYSNDKNYGKGHTIRSGLKRINADFYIYSDIDLPYKVEYILKMISTFLEDKCDVIVGIRNNNYYDKIPLQRKVISKLLIVINSLIGIKFKDTQGGLKGVNNIGKKYLLETTINRYLFDFEFMKLISRNENLIVKAITIEPKVDLEMKRMSVRNIIRSGLDYIRVLLK